jgi:hypothetical protein
MRCCPNSEASVLIWGIMYLTSIMADSDYNDFGTIEGRLETIQESYGTLQFFIRDVFLRQRVRCYFPEELLPSVFATFRKRVEVSGVIHYRKDGTPISIEAEHILGQPDDSELPTAEDVRGIFLS